MSLSEENKELKSLDIIFDSAQNKLQFQSDQWNSIDQKNAIVIAIYGIILAIFLTGGITDVFVIYKKTLLNIWLFTLVVGMACNLLSLKPKDIDIPPKIDSLIDKYLNKEIADTKAIILSSMNKSISRNDGIMRKKTALMSFSINICLPIALGFSVVAVFLKILKG
ncbi:hypothetical protein [Desulfobacula sp.]|uniref:hypothetical protein n=1 Tax=Desulfobacula sp. TaxID=2593537 RepID=UPI002714A942|nr:hypothetical protein [Desulfobacula sp.]